VVPPSSERDLPAPAPGAHHLVRYLQHARREFRRAVDGMSVADSERRVGGINSVAWMVGHLAWQEQAYWLTSRGEAALADLDAFGGGRPEAPPQFDPLFDVWARVTSAADGWLTSLDDADLRSHLVGRRLFERENIGTLLTRTSSHYYLHIGQITAVRRLLGERVPAFVGPQTGAEYP
jgi:hypothetical protein